FGLFRSQYDSQSKNGDYYLLRTRQNKSGFDAISNLRTGPDNLEFGFHLAEILRGRIYSFRAERLNVGTCPLGQNETLQNDASNLPEVLNVLQGNPERFREFNRLVSRIFPNIYWISVAPAGNALKILIWTEDPKHSRKDLAIDLAESGTGVGQVLAMLYVAINSKFSIPIIIDEPNSFLHPGAARKLIETLKEFPRHQYIISTHSPEIVGATNPKTLSLLRWEKPQTKVQAMNASEVTELRECLLEVGVKLSDIFGADQILWVEGDTEEECFPELVRGSTDAVGTSIVGVRNTGDFETRRMSAEAIVDVYKKLSGAEATLPPTIAFVFDREGRSQDEMDQLIQNSNGLIHFLPRRMYENYLVCPEALSALMAELPDFRTPLVTPDQIKVWLATNGGSGKYGAPSPIQVLDKEWLEKVHAGKLLCDMFQELSEGRYIYRKTEYAVKLTSWLLKNQPDTIKELSDFLSGILASAQKTRTQ
ncbi:MAG: ATP-binding protein, partial [Nitrospirota bacterium]|nr:ATP-binding protein [Nitrospirota bacterium]